MPQHIHRTTAVALALIALAALLLNPASASAITRSEVLARGKVWVDKKVPYSNSGWADEAGNIVGSPSLGWRRDCSGFASYCLDLRWSNGTPKSCDSGTILGVLVPISKDQLQPGDIIDRPNNAGWPYGHAIVFVGWADEARTMYWSYEESNSNSGTIMRLVSYPFYGEPGFAPYRYKGIEEDWEPWVEPVSGATRYETAVLASQRAFSTGTVETVVVCSGAGWADALGGSALAGAVGGAVVLTKPDELPSCVATEIARLGATRAIVVGGASAVDGSVADALAAAGCTRVDRIGGADRYETSALVASATVAELRARGREPDGVCYVGSGVTFADALAVSPIATAKARPVLLSRPSELPTPTADALRALAPTRTVLLGGERALETTVASACAEIGGVVERIAGASRYDTAARIAEHCVAEGLGWGGTCVATGYTFPDALAGGVMQGALGAPLLLTPSTTLHVAPAALLTTHAPEIGRARCLGGLNAVSASVRGQIAVCLGSLD